MEKGLTMKQKAKLALEIAGQIEAEAEGEEYDVIYLVAALIFGPRVKLSC